MNMISDPRWKDVTMEATAHNVMKFPTRRDAMCYLEANKLTDYVPFGLCKDGVEWYQICLEMKPEKDASVSDTLLALWDECKDDRDTFILAAEMMGVKKGTATTYWYTFKKEPG